MSWGLACCCAPAAHGEADRIRSSGSAQGLGAPLEKPLPSKAAGGDEEATGQGPPRENGEGAVKGGGRGSGRSSSPPALRGGEPPGVKAGAGGSREPSTGQADLEAETTSVASSRSVKSNRSLGTTSSIASEYIQERIPARQREASRVQQAMKSFVRMMVRGQQMGVISPDGQLRTCSCSLDKRLKNFVIELKGSVRQISLGDISEVFQGTEPEDIDTPLDELCSTLMLASGECISFHFADVPAREQFAMCLQILVDGQQ
mmetsp:Transcript_29423/g.62637  ORF Transcript_29423/g.62637 Transcript_29423/m.62637 type:complete len:260 (-) Transcript_29423:33-812(-)